MSLGILTSSLRVLKNLDLKNIEYDKLLGMIPTRVGSNDDAYSHLRDRRTRLELVMISAAVCGIEFCYAAETAFVSPTLLKIGVPVIYMTLVWCLSPLIGFLLVPILGSLSDRCRSKLGRRRPFILLLSLGIFIGLIFVPNGKSIGIQLGDVYHTAGDETNTSLYIENGTDMNSSMSTEDAQHHHRHPWSILFTVIGVVLLDFSCDACQSPCRAYMLDVCLPEDHSAGLTTFTILAGLGGAFGYLMGGINWEGTSVGENFGGHVKVVFTIVLFIYIICLLLTMMSVKEIPLDKLGLTVEDFQGEKKKINKFKYRKFTNEVDEQDEVNTVNFYKDYGSNLNNAFPSVEQNCKEKDGGKESYIENNHTSNLDSLPHSPKLNQTQTDNLEDLAKGLPPLPSEISLKTYLKSIVRMPRSLAVLCLTNLFCWMSLVCYSLYFTDFVGQSVYGGDPKAPHGSYGRLRYEAGVRTGSFGMALYSISCSIYSLNIERLVKRFRARPVYICSQLVYTVGMIILALWRHPVAVFVLSPTAGVMYATLFTMPYLLVAHYHDKNKFDENVDGQERVNQIRGLGTDIALVSSMVFVAQFLLSSCMGSIVHAAGSTVAVVVTSTVLSFCGAVSATQVTYLDL